MLRRLQIPVTMCCVLTGEVGRVLRHLLEDDEGVTVVPVNKDGRGSAYLHDRRDGKRVIVAEDEGDPLGRHELDDLYSAALRSGSESRLVILSGPTGDATLPADVYRRLTADLRRQGTTVLADLSGERLRAVVDGGVDILKVSHEELLDDGLVSEATVPEIIEAMQSLRRQGVGAVIVTRA